MAKYPDAKLLIDGELRPAENGATYPDIGPWDGEEIGRAADASLGDLDKAIGAARRAFDTTDWSTNHKKRVATLRVFADLLRKNRDRLAEIAHDEVGAPLGTIFSAQCDWPLGMLDFVLDTADNYEWEDDLGVAKSGPGANSRRKVWKEPVGVVAAITPWNVPTQINLAKIVPALAAGCTVILKPAPETPMLAAVLGEVAVEAKLPPGVFNVITSSGPAEIGEALVKDPRVDLISFTGSTATGKRIMANAAEKLSRVFLELGGKSAMIVLDDADFIPAVSRAAGVVYNAGQGCATHTRLLVPKSRYDEAIAILTQVMGSIQYGDPTAPTQIMGPLISDRQRQRVMSYIEIGKQEGARLVLGGKIPAKHDKGFWFEPTLFADVTNDMRIAQEEIFGPVLVVIPFEDDEDAIRIANDSIYGLSGGVASKSMERALNVARKVRTGTFSVNGGSWFAGDTPFGGFKQSGIGREMGVAGFEEYLELKTVGLPA
ncbi:aldehyde dehydrogenase family protein [Phenylobacterium sp.]|jgi:aldehyde dehydrogenase (NAD+)|uniref:aldehyde dehydrogenase family protein n=1 Tax=Phenylobacterium sp. TaxID=1871053 RepID=UPI002F3FE9C6